MCTDDLKDAMVLSDVDLLKSHAAVIGCSSIKKKLTKIILQRAVYKCAPPSRSGEGS